MFRAAHTFRARRIRIAIFAAGALVAASTPALACNPFEMLFGGCRETQAFRAPVDPAPAPRAERETHERIRLEHRAAPRARRLGSAINAYGISGKQNPIAATRDAPVGSLALFERDKTLRVGDVVVTNAGFRVYRGNGSFTPVGDGDGALSQLQKASFDSKAAAFAAATAPVSVAQAAAPAPTRTAAADSTPLPSASPMIGLRPQARERLQSASVGG